MSVSSPCEVCGTADVEGACQRCGQLVCERHFEADLGQRVSASTTLFTVTDMFGETRATVTADSDGIFWRSRRLPQVASGEYVCSVGTDVDTY